MSAGYHGYYPAFPPQPPLPVSAAPFYPADPYAAAAAAYAAANSPGINPAMPPPQPSPPYVADHPPYLTAQMNSMQGGGVSPFASPYLGPASGGVSPFLAPFGYTPYMYAGYHSQQPSPFLHPMGIGMMGPSPTLNPVASSPTSPNLSGRVSPTPSWSNVTSTKGAYELFIQNLGANHLTTNVYIRGLSPTISDDLLLQLCSP